MVAYHNLGRPDWKVTRALPPRSQLSQGPHLVSPKFMQVGCRAPGHPHARFQGAEAGSPDLTLKADTRGSLLTLQAGSGFRKTSLQDSKEFPIGL